MANGKTRKTTKRTIKATATHNIPKGSVLVPKELVAKFYKNLTAMNAFCSVLKGT